MTEVVTSDAIDSKIWNNFYELISENVSSVTIKGSGGPNTKTVTVQRYSSTFPYQSATSSADYPIIIINPPTGDFEGLTFRDTIDNGLIEIEINATQAEAADKLKDRLRYYLLTQRPDLAALGLYGLQVSDEDSAQVTRGEINVHIRRIVFSFQYRFTSW